MLGKDRAEFTDHFADILAQIRWLELKWLPFEVNKKDQNHSWLNARYIRFLLQMAQRVA